MDLKCSICHIDEVDLYRVDDDCFCKSCYEKDVRCRGCGSILDEDDFEEGYCSGCR